MASFACARHGATWQEDFAPLADRLYRWFGRCLRQESDREEKAHECVLLTMKVFKRKWEKGQPFSLCSTWFLTKYRRGDRFLRKEKHTRDKRCPLPKTVDVPPTAIIAHARRLTDYTVRDAFADLQRLRRHYLLSIRMLYAGWTFAEICERLNMHPSCIARAKRDARAVLASGS